jgi:hypothetical protein
MSHSPFKTRKLYPDVSHMKQEQNWNEKDIYLFNVEEYDDFLRRIYSEWVVGKAEISKRLLDLWKIILQGRLLDKNGIYVKENEYFGPDSLKNGKFNISEEIGNLLLNISQSNTKDKLGTPTKINQLLYSGFIRLINKESKPEEKDEGETRSIEFFEKSLLGIFFYMNYLQKVNKNVCIPITDTEGLMKGLQVLISNLNHLTREEFLEKYPILFHQYEKIKGSFKNQNEYIDELLYEILLWMGPFLIITESQITERNILQISNTFRKLFEKCEQSKSDFIVIPFLFALKNCGHANILVADTKNKTIERFEPHGSIGYFTSSCPQRMADEMLMDLFQEYGYTYLSPKQICPEIGPQEEYEKQKGLRQEEGYCMTWSAIYANLRLENISENKEIVKNMTNDLTKYIMSLFADQKVEKKSFELINLYFQDRLNILMKYFQENLDLINQTFGTTFRLRGRRLIF